VRCNADDEVVGSLAEALECDVERFENGNAAVNTVESGSRVLARVDLIDDTEHPKTVGSADETVRRLGVVSVKNSVGEYECSAVHALSGPVQRGARRARPILS
jgi:hypothetical protein